MISSTLASTTVPAKARKVRSIVMFASPSVCMDRKSISDPADDGADVHRSFSPRDDRTPIKQKDRGDTAYAERRAGVPRGIDIEFQQP